MTKEHLNLFALAPLKRASMAWPLPHIHVRSGTGTS
jgi:hypothetical protein